ncbi:MAG: cupredoxin domain-containing protein [Gammaproteobacteria bacterium]|jgi:plastocyanin domain-containing protein
MMDTLVVDIAGLALIGLIVWWFWLSHPAARRLDDAPITIVAEDGVYSPAHIEVSRAGPIVLRFLRKDPSPCAAKVIFTDLGVSADLPVGEERELRLDPPPPGDYGFVCEMHMYQGTLTVK